MGKAVDLKSSISADDWGCILGASYLSEQVYLTAATRPYIQAALDRAYQALCPWPCVRICDDWWFTADGSYVANCQFLLSRDEAITQSEAARLLDVGIPAIWQMIRRGKLRVYRLPDHLLRTHGFNKKSGWPNKPWYLRRSEVDSDDA